ncbi:hypothetical protein TNCV_2082221 [Trichonephila clavipes]|nr:hypothetical protein TNCV_2082221 [Trichonephila clavipes]
MSEVKYPEKSIRGSGEKNKSDGCHPTSKRRKTTIFSPKKSYRTIGLIASKRSDRNANGRRARKSTERKEDATVLKRSQFYLNSLESRQSSKSGLFFFFVRLRQRSLHL